MQIAAEPAGCSDGCFSSSGKFHGGVRDLFDERLERESQEISGAANRETVVVLEEDRSQENSDIVLIELPK